MGHPVLPYFTKTHLKLAQDEWPALQWSTSPAGFWLRGYTNTGKGKKKKRKLVVTVGRSNGLRRFFFVATRHDMIDDDLRQLLRRIRYTRWAAHQPHEGG